MTAEEYLKENGYENISRWTTSSVIQVMNGFLQSKINISDEEIARMFFKSPNNHIHPDRYRAEGAKILRDKLKQ